jgi:hypothetical protein
MTKAFKVAHSAKLAKSHLIYRARDVLELYGIQETLSATGRAPDC